jgi:rubrerythrin
MANKTGTKDATYNLVSVLYHALQGADLYEQYANDAGGDQDLASFFREAQQQEKQRADRAKQLLAKRLQQGS